jgi:hypothetical protein
MNRLLVISISIQKALSFFVFSLLLHPIFAQTQDSTKHVLNFTGAASVTNNGFSFIPSFSLGKPAAIFNFNVNSGKRLSFEPEFRFALEGKPWSFIFIWRYKLINAEKFKLTVGTHLPALNFRTVPVVKNGVSLDVIQTQRFFPVAEVMPTYVVSKDISIGLFYLYGHSLEKDATKNTNFLSFRANFSRIGLGEQLYLRFNPQVFYLKTDALDGFYAAANLTLAKKDFPLFISTMMNKALKTDLAGKDFIWNLSLNYTFGTKYVKP